MLNTLIITCMLTGATPTIQQPKDTTKVVIKFPQMKKPTWTTGKK